MPTTLPTPVAAALGIVPAVLDNARKLPGKAVQIPVLAVSGALTALETWRREYDELAQRGERLVGRLRGTSVDEFENRIEDLIVKTPFAATYDAAEDTVAKVTELLDRAATRTPPVKATAVPVTAVPATPVPVTAVPVTAVPATPVPATAAPATPVPATPVPVETAATPDVVEVVEAVTAAVAASPDAAPVTSHDELPLADYDHMTLGALRGRLRALSVTDLVRVRDYEKAHAHRLPVVTLLDNRIAKLATEAAAGPGQTPATQTPSAPASAPAVESPAVESPAAAKNAPTKNAPAKNAPTKNAQAKKAPTQKTPGNKALAKKASADKKAHEKATEKATKKATKKDAPEGAVAERTVPERAVAQTATPTV